MTLLILDAAAHTEMAAREPALVALIEQHGHCPLAYQAHDSPFQALARAIVFQQLSGKAATTILNRVIALYPESEFPTPENLLGSSEDELRAVGLSRQKAAALKDLSAKRLEGVVPGLGEIEHLPDDEIIARLTQVKGIGRWSVEMYLMFTLGRTDIWPIDDLGVRKGWGLLKGLEAMPTPKALAPMADHLKPWRSAVAWYCWRAVDTALMA